MLLLTAGTECAIILGMEHFFVHTYVFGPGMLARSYQALVAAESSEEAEALFETEARTLYQQELPDTAIKSVHSHINQAKVDDFESAIIAVGEGE